jgi:hypothetical protein
VKKLGTLRQTKQGASFDLNVHLEEDDDGNLPYNNGKQERIFLVCRFLFFLFSVCCFFFNRD